MDLSVKKIGNLVDDRARLNDLEQAKKNLRDLGKNTLPELRGNAINNLGLVVQPQMPKVKMIANTNSTSKLID